MTSEYVFLGTGFVFGIHTMFWANLKNRHENTILTSIHTSETSSDTTASILSNDVSE